MANIDAPKSGNRWQWILVVLLVVAAFVIGSLFTKVQYLEKNAQTPTANTGTAQQPTPQPTISLSQIKDLFKKNVIKFGDANRKLTIVEIVDPSCPYCSMAAGENNALNKQAGTQFTLVADGGTYVAPVPEFKKLVDAGKASFIYIYYPGHGNGQMGMKALLCANDEGKFWEAHSLIMSAAGYDLMNNKIQNDKTKSGDLANFLSSVEDPAKMKACLDSGKYEQRLADDTQLATTLGVQGTPGFYINSTVFPGAYSFTDMQTAVNNALK